MEILSASPRDIRRAAAALKAGALVAFPTETVYGLGGDAFNTDALAKIFEVKRRPRFDPLILHIAETETLSRIVDMFALDGATAGRISLLAERFWPGPLTMVLPKRPEVPNLATAGLSTVAIRLPSHPVARRFIDLATGIVAAPSANPFGYLSPTRAEHVIAQLGDKVNFVIDGGKSCVGVESTVLDLSGDVPRVLRPGGISLEEISALIGPVEAGPGSSAESLSGEIPLSPGLLKSHYAPRTRLVLYREGELASLPDVPGEGRLYFSLPAQGAAMPPKRTMVLSESGNPAEAAANLFDMLHKLDGMGLSQILAEEAPASGLGAAINDRLRRAGNA